MINAVSISTRVEDMIEGKNIEGFIHSVFDYACNIQLNDNNLIGLISSKYGDNPYSISIDLPSGQTMKTISLQQGMKVTINRDRIRSAVGAFYINLQHSKSWDPSLPKEYGKLVSKTQLKRNLDTVIRVLLGNGNFYGIGPLLSECPDILKAYRVQESYEKVEANHYSSFIAPRIKELIYGIIKEDQALIDNMLMRIVGFGPGLTPSADDLIVGLMASLYYLGKYLKKDIKVISYLENRLDNELTNQTTLVSQQMLKAATQGEFARPIKELCMAIISSEEKNEIEKAVLEAISLGSTSGTDTMVGLLIGAYIINEHNI